MAAREIILLVAIVLPVPGYATGVPEAVDWIISQQNEDGSWGDEGKGIEYQIHVTSEVLSSVSNFKESLPRNTTDIVKIKGTIERGILWFENHIPQDTIGLASSLKAAISDSLSTNLINDQNEDGGWGPYEGFQSSPWYTAKALLSLNTTSQLVEIERGAEYLIATQEKDGSWENTATATSAAILALAHIYSVNPEDKYLISAKEGEDWLLTKQGKDGEWYDASSTASAISALKVMYSIFRTRDERLSIDKGKVFLEKNQREDGSWGLSPSSRIFDDIQITSEVTSSLVLDLPYKVIKPNLLIKANISPAHVMGGDRVKMAVTLSNMGWLDIEDIDAIIRVPDAIGGREYNWTLDQLEIGRNITKVFIISMPQGSIGEHVNYVDVNFSQKNEIDIEYRGKGISKVIHVHGNPIELRLIPNAVLNGSKGNFTAILANMGDTELVLENISIDLEDNWDGVLIFENNATIIIPRGNVSIKVFEAIGPETLGSYNVSVNVLFRHPHVGERWVSFDQNITVGQKEYSPKALTVLPSKNYNLLSLAIFLAVFILLLNLLLGLDVEK